MNKSITLQRWQKVLNIGGALHCSTIENMWGMLLLVLVQNQFANPALTYVPNKRAVQINV